MHVAIPTFFAFDSLGDINPACHPADRVCACVCVRAQRKQNYHTAASAVSVTSRHFPVCAVLQGNTFFRECRIFAEFQAFFYTKTRIVPCVSRATRVATLGTGPDRTFGGVFREFRAIFFSLSVFRRRRVRRSGFAFRGFRVCVFAQGFVACRPVRVPSVFAPVTGFQAESVRQFPFCVEEPISGVHSGRTD